MKEIKECYEDRDANIARYVNPRRGLIKDSQKFDEKPGHKGNGSRPRMIGNKYQYSGAVEIQALDGLGYDPAHVFLRKQSFDGSLAGHDTVLKPSASSFSVTVTPGFFSLTRVLKNSRRRG